MRTLLANQNIDRLMKKYGLDEIGFGCFYQYDTRYADDGPVIAWTGQAYKKGYINLYPLDRDAVWAPTLEEAMEKLSVLAL